MTVIIPAADAERTPLWLSSRARQSAGSIPSAAAALRNGSGCGLLLVWTSRVIRAWKRSTMLCGPRLACTLARLDEVAMARGIPTRSRWSRISSTPAFKAIPATSSSRKWALTAAFQVATSNPSPKWLRTMASLAWLGRPTI